MDRKKPSLTSPWKVGFLVALLMVVTSLGVSYLITGTFGVTWHWIQFGGLSPSTWTFNLGAFLEEMAPLLALTFLLAFAAYVLVAGAVRRYKAYVDSGVEYKQLLKSIKTIEDLEDENVLQSLKQHPELREFLMGVKHRFANHERSQGDRKHAHAQSPGESRTSAPDERPRLQSETAQIITAITGGRDGFSNEMALTVPELKQIERALRGYFAKRPDAPVAAPIAVAPPSGEADALRALLRSSVTAMRHDVDACAGGARELESALNALSASVQSGAKSAPAANTEEIRKRVDVTAEALSALGEETRRIAIAAAMQASGGPEADTIKVADELRTLATRFNTVAQHWKQTAPPLKEALSAAAAGGRSGNSDAADAAATAVTRARLWSERAIAINEHVRALERAIEVNDSEPAVAEQPAAPAAPVHEDFERTPVAPRRAPAEPSNETPDDFITRGSGEMFGSDNETDVSFADIPGFEKEHRLFGEDKAPAPVRDDQFVVDNANEKRWDLEHEASVEEVLDSAPAAPATSSTSDSDGFLTGPRPVVSPRAIERPAKSPAAPRFAKPEVVADIPAVTATLDPDADAVDLYELGAVDCVQSA